MEIKKELKDISLQITEPEYREMPELSYSLLSRFERDGFDGLSHLYDKIESPALLQGSMVDTLITGNQAEFNERFYVVDIPPMADKEVRIANLLFDCYGTEYPSFTDLPFQFVLEAANEASYQKNWKDETRVKVLKERCSTYYAVKTSAGDRTIVGLKTYYDVMAMVEALKDSPATYDYFADDDSSSPVRRYYQLKFKANLDGVGYRCMADELIVDYKNKVIYPIDLKTSGHSEWNFQDSFCTWNYMIQGRLYWRIIRTNLDNDSYFKDFELKDYRFIVVNKETLTPLVWEFPYTKTTGTLVDDKGNKYRDPFVIGKELRYYLDNMPKVPIGVQMNGANMITCLHEEETK